MTANPAQEESSLKYPKSLSIRLDEIEATQRQILQKLTGIETRIAFHEAAQTALYLNEKRAPGSVKG